MSIGNGLSFAQASALAGINPISLLGMGLGSDSSVNSGVNSLTTSSGYRPSDSTPAPGFSTINQVTGSGFGSSTSSFFTPSNSIFTNTGSNSFTNNLPSATTLTPTPTSSKSGSPDGNNLDGKTTTVVRHPDTKLPAVDKSALLDIAADARPSIGKAKLGSDPPA